MDNNELKEITHEFLNIIPLFHRKIIKEHCKFSDEPFNHPHFQIMGILKSNGKSSISDVAKKLGISTPNMTKLLNKLISEEMITRNHSEIDRRIIYIYLTEKGHTYLDKKYNELVYAIVNKFKNLSDDELKDLSSSIKTLNTVLSNLISK